MRKKIIFAIVIVLLFSNLPISAEASNVNTDYEMLTQYDSYIKGYGKHIGELHYNIAAKETNNYDEAKIYYDQFRNNINSDGFLDGISQKVQGLPGYEKMIAIDRELSSAIIGASMSAWDTVKGWFSKFNNLFSTEEYFDPEGTTLSENRILAPEGYSFYFNGPNHKDVRAKALLLGFESYCYEVIAQYKVNPTSISSPNNIDSIHYRTSCRNYIGHGGESEFKEWQNRSKKLNLATYVALLNESGSGITLTLRSDTDQSILPISNNNYTNTIVNDINNFIQNTDMSQYIPKNYKPVVKSYLVCAGETYTLKIDDSIFKLPNGEVVEVGTNETAVVNGVPCKLGFHFPETDVEEGKVVTKNPDGTKTDLAEEKENENNPKPQKPDCDGVLCWLSSLWDGVTDFVSAIADVVAAIANLGTKIAELLLDLLEKIFHLIVPEDLDFIQNLFGNVKDKFDEKFVIAEDMQLLIQSLFTETNSNPLVDMSFYVPAADKTFDLGFFALVDEFVPTIKRIMSALITLTTIFYLYRKVTGSGGVLEK